MASGGSKYFNITPIKRQQQSPGDVERGLAVGQEIGKLLGGLSGAIKEQQKNALANKLMNTENAPRAALVDPGGQNVTTTTPGQTTPGDPGWEDPDPDPIPVQPTLGINTNIGGDSGDGYNYDLSNDVAATKASQSLPTTTSFVPNQIPAGVSTAGTAPHTGGTQEMDLQKEILAQQVQKQSLASATAKAADEQAQQSGTGKYALEQQKQRLEMANIQSQIDERKAKLNAPAKVDKNAPPVDITNEPVTSQDQLNKYVDANYGNGTSTALLSAAADASQDLTLDSNKKPTGMVNLLVGKKPVSIPVSEAATYVKQANVLRRKQNLPLLRVPGEDPNLGRTADNPFPVTSKMEGLGRAPGTFVKLPDGTVMKVK